MVGRGCVASCLGKNLGATDFRHWDRSIWECAIWMPYNWVGGPPIGLHDVDLLVPQMVCSHALAAQVAAENLHNRLSAHKWVG